ncbi:MAG: hypothetical protein V7742_18815 [Halioglobus sp.]
MSTLSVAYVHLKLSASVSEIEAVQEYLTIIGKNYAHELYKQEIYIEVHVEAGSLKAWVVVAGSLYIGIGQYGSFRSGIDHLVKDARTFGEAVSSTFIETADIDNEKVYRIERRLGIPGRIKRLLSKIDQIEQADYVSRLAVRDLSDLRLEVQGIVDDLDSEEDISLLVSNLPNVYRDVRRKRERNRGNISNDISAMRPDYYEDFVSDGTLSKFPSETLQSLYLTLKD